MKRDRDYLRLLGNEFPNADACAAEIINLRAILGLPKGNEYFFSDIHGEYKSFIHLLRSASGVVRERIREIFGNMLLKSEQDALAELIYYPEKEINDKSLGSKLSTYYNLNTCNDAKCKRCGGYRYH